MTPSERLCNKPRQRNIFHPNMISRELVALASRVGKRGPRHRAGEGDVWIALPDARTIVTAAEDPLRS